MANTRIGRTVSVAGSRQKATFSAWIKRTGLGESWIAKFGGNYSQGNYMQIGFDDNDGCFIIGDTPSSTPRMQSTRKFRDTNAWYNYVVAFDTTQNTASDRLKFYINGELITAYGTATYPTLNQNLNFNMTGSYNNAWLGGRGESTYEFNGLMSHVNWIDGTAYDASAFGSTDSVTGEWKINTAPSVTYGTNGYFMLKDGNSLTDASGKGNNFTLLTGALTDTKDCPSNNFPTIIPASNAGSYKFYNGATTSFGDGTSDWTKSTIGTLGASDGKYYWEIKLGMNGGATDYNITGVVRSDKAWSNSNVYSNGGFNGLQSANAAGGLGIYSQTGASMGGALYIGGSSVNLTNGDIVMYALDLDNRKLWVGKNGTWADDGNSGYVGNPTTGAYPLWGTGEFTTGATYLPCNIQYQTSDCSYNFGNGYFKTTAVASAGTNASGNGIFEYDVPTGFTALSTKGLNL